jgi:tryptophanyl-tRNA synthetase
MSKDIVLTGITTTGTPHLGNYVGAIRPAIERTKTPGTNCFFFLADYHAIIKCREPQRIQQSTLEIAATWLALGLDPDAVTFYRQSDVPEIPELTWILSCVTAKGLMNRAHAYKAAVDENEADGGKDPDKGITMGLFGYPVLMAADILMFQGKKIPVGKDQIQHIEMARDMAQRFNHLYGEHFTLPEAVVDEDLPQLEGLDGRKMSKSYDNTIPLFVAEKKLKKLCNKIKTDSTPPEEPKDPDESTLFHIFKAFASPEDTEIIRKRYAEGIGWGEMKNLLFEELNQILSGPRAEYEKLLADPGHVESVLLKGADKAREISVPFLDKVRKAVGVRSLA